MYQVETYLKYVFLHSHIYKLARIHILLVPFVYENSLCFQCEKK